MSEGKSFWTSLPGVLTGLAAVITSVGGLLVVLQQMERAEKPPERSGVVAPERGSAVSRLEIRPAVVPHDLRPSTVYDISILVVSEKGLPVEGVVVEVGVGGGSFQDTGNFTTIGNTDARGVFRTQWKSLESIPGSYGFSVQARKAGLTTKGDFSLSYHR